MKVIMLKIVSLLCNCVLALISMFLLLIALSSWFLPPTTRISPYFVSDHHQYSIAAFFIGVTSISVLLLATFGIVSSLMRSSFCMFLYLMILLVQISMQLVLSAFTVANRHKIHEIIASKWHVQIDENYGIDCKEDIHCIRHLESLIQAERIISLSFLIFLSLQIFLLFISYCYCSQLSEREQYEAIEKDNANSD